MVKRPDRGNRESPTDRPETPAKRAPSSSAGEAPAQEGPLCSLARARVLAFATGVLYFLAFPGIDMWPLAFVAWVPLLLAMQGRSTRTCTSLAWISGVTMTFIGFTPRTAAER